MKIKTSALPLEGALLLEVFKHEDLRGKFTKYFENRMFEELDFGVKEMFMSSNRKNVVRGLHLQKPKAQARIVWCLKGRIYDVIVDLRKKSETFKKWHGVELSASNGKGVYVPKGFAHGFLSLEDDSQVLYIANEPYSPETEGGIIYTDPVLNIKWPNMEKPPLMSERDSRFAKFDEEKHAYE